MSALASVLANVPRETFARLERLAELVEEENQRQNLVSPRSLAEIWTRHIEDSAQLVRFAPANAANWLDLGSGAGFPGLVIALMSSAHITLVEARRLRAAFLVQAGQELELSDRIEIVASRVERMESRPFEIITARAFAPLDKLFDLAERFSYAGTRWILPKGKNAKSELEAALASWQGEFRLEPSLTDPDARIIVAEQVSRRKPKERQSR